MTQQRAERPSFTFSKGINTDASPCTFPPDFSVDESNFDILPDGTRRRRRGVAKDSNTNTIVPYNSQMVVRSFKWPTVGGNPNVNFVVVQYGSTLHFYDDGLTISDHRKSFTIDLLVRKVETSTIDEVLSTVVDCTSGRGRLFVVGKHIEPFVVTYVEALNNVTTAPISIRERDFEGIADGISNTTKPTTMPDSHHYNLLNAGWREEDINLFFTNNSAYPSKNLIYSLGFRRATIAGFDPNDGTREFSDEKLLGELFQDAPAPSGHFVRNPFDTSYALLPSTPATVRTIFTTGFSLSSSLAGTTVTLTITAVGHGLSVADEVGLYSGDLIGMYLYYISSRDGSVVPLSLTENRFSVLSVPTADTYTVALVLPNDFTNDYNFTEFAQTFDFSDAISNTQGAISPYRPSTAAFFAGRAWYSGIHSGRLDNKIYFSQVIENDAQAGKCYQVADPTNPNISDLVETDGGVLTISEATQIHKITAYSSSLLVFASNGVWQIGPGQRGYFTATSYSVRKVSEVGTDGPGSIVVAEGIPVYWGKASIYAVTQDPNNGFLVVQNISVGKVDNLFNMISYSEKARVQSTYDSLNKRIVWAYNVEYSDSVEIYQMYNTMLLYDVKFEAFLSWRTLRFSSLFSIKDVVADLPGRTVKLVTNYQDGRTFIGDFTSTTYKDWGLTELPAYLVTGFDTAKSPNRFKYAPIVHAFMKRTETGFVSVDGDFVPVNESSLTMQARWDWADNSVAGKWGTAQQIYRKPRLFTPTTIGGGVGFALSWFENAWFPGAWAGAAWFSNGTGGGGGGIPTGYDDGSPLVITRNKVRGRGRSLHLKFEAGAGKDAHLLGWTTNFIVLMDN